MRLSTFDVQDGSSVCLHLCCTRDVSVMCVCVFCKLEYTFVTLLQCTGYFTWGFVYVCVLCAICSNLCHIYIYIYIHTHTHTHTHTWFIAVTGFEHGVAVPVQWE